MQCAGDERTEDRTGDGEEGMGGGALIIQLFGFKLSQNTKV
jgi:hypothetical protein